MTNKLDRQIEKILDKFARHWMYGPGTDGKVIETRNKIKQSILKAIMEKAPKEKVNDAFFGLGFNSACKDFELVIKDILK